MTPYGCANFPFPEGRRYTRRPQRCATTEFAVPDGRRGRWFAQLEALVGAAGVRRNLIGRA